MANKLRGEVTLKLGGNDYTLRPTFNALCEMEDVCKAPILRIMEEMQSGTIRLSVLANIVWAGMRGYDSAEALTTEEVGEMIVSDGLLNVMEQKGSNGINPITQFVLNGVLGGEEVSKEEPKKQMPKKTKDLA